MSAVLSICLVAVAVLSGIGTSALRRYAQARALLDLPNERSLHTIPTPRGGGLAIAVSIAIALPALWLAGWLDGAPALALAGAIPVAITGWLDDRHNLPARVRLVAQLCAAAWAVYWLGGFSTLSAGSLHLTLGAAGSVLAVLAIVWLTNLYNFMDGIDGIAGAEAVTAGATMAAILWLGSAHGLAALAGVVAAASAGFLVFNWSPARIFMGDVGSTTLGFTLATIALAGDRQGAAPALLLLLPLLVFIIDATWTLLRRALRGERVTEAHRSHVYQQLVQLGWSHRRVSTLVVLLNVGLALATWHAWRHPLNLPLVLAAALLTIVAVAAAALLVARPRVRRQAPSAGR